jgi:hypothetical protein
VPESLAGEQLTLFNFETSQLSIDASDKNPEVETTPQDDRYPRIIKAGWLEIRPDDIPFWHPPIIQWSDTCQEKLGSKKSSDPKPQLSPLLQQNLDPNSVSELGSKGVECLHLKHSGFDDVVPKPLSPTNSILISIPCPVADSIDCATIDPKWHGSIERKKINNRPYYYWRHYEGQKRASKYLSKDWQKALKKLAKYQKSALVTIKSPK